MANFFVIIMKFVFLFFVILGAYAAQEIPTVGNVIADFNSRAIVTCGEMTIPYQHDPLSQGIPVFQGERAVVKPGEATFICTGGISTCQVVVVGNKKGKMLMEHIDQFFKPEGIADLLAYFREDTTATAAGAKGDGVSKVESTLSAYIIINKNFFDCRGEDDFRSAYHCGIEHRLKQLSRAFEKSGIRPEILRLSSSTDLSEIFRKYLKDDQEYAGIPDLRLSSIFKRFSDDVTAGICVNVATGEIAWWSLPLTRVYTVNPGKVAWYYRLRAESQKAYMGRLALMMVGASSSAQ